MYVCMYVCNASIHLNTSQHVYVCLCICLYMSVYVCVSMYTCVCLCMLMSVNVCLFSMSVYVCICVSMCYVCVCVSMYVSVCLCMPVLVCAYARFYHFDSFCICMSIMEDTSKGLHQTSRKTTGLYGLSEKHPVFHPSCQSDWSARVLSSVVHVWEILEIQCAYH